jgi:hypothetical protein
MDTSNKDKKHMDNRPVYVSPRVMRLDDVHSGKGQIDCVTNGSGFSGNCQTPGTQVAGNCSPHGNRASGTCANPGSSARI